MLLVDMDLLAEEKIFLLQISRLSVSGLAKV
jgi:hypothetical protein